MIEKTAPVQGYYRKMKSTEVKMKVRVGRVPRLPGAFQLLAFCLVVAVSAWPLPAAAAKIEYRFTTWNGPDIRVFLTRPVNLAPDRPVVFVMHGADRDALELRDQWHDLAIKHDFLLVVPEFREADFAGHEHYEQGWVFDDQGVTRAESGWSYAAIEAIFDDVRSRFQMSVNTYSMYGNSVGAQFVQRYILHVPEARVSRFVMANADWYMMPDFDLTFPYGLRHSAVDRNRLEKGLQQPVTILLGEKDTGSDDEKLNRIPEIMAQGPDRLARAQAFFDTARTAAARLDVPFNWSLETVPGAGRDDRSMAPAAIPYLLGEH
jgi:pimeloyl-ACP methyl ester carboxylesterase